MDLRVAPVDSTGQIQLAELEKLLGSRTKLVAVTQVSNALGTVTPVKEIVSMVRELASSTPPAPRAGLPLVQD